MKLLTSIVALNEKGAIGCRNELPWRLKTDMQFFRAQTLNNVVIMGRRTYDSIGGELRKRHNIVLSHNSVLFPQTENSEVATSIPEALAKASRCRGKKIYIIGGASTYKQFAPYVERYLITIVKKEVRDADAFFDESIFRLEDDWEWKKIDNIKWSPSVDDAEFDIFEVIHKRSLEIREKRNDVISEYLAKNPGRARRRSGGPLSSNVGFGSEPQLQL
jgi:dihydrofolate reductase